MDHSPPGSSIHGIFQARVLEWGAIAFSNSRTNIPPPKYPFHYRDWDAKVGSQKTPGVTGKFGLGVQNEARQSLIEFWWRKSLVIANTLFQQHKRGLYTGTSPDGQYQKQIDDILCSQRWRSPTQSAKTRPRADCGSDQELLIAKLRLKLKKIGKITRPFSSVQSLSHFVRLFVTSWTQHTRPPWPSPTPRVHPNLCPLSQWCHPSISSSVIPFFSCPQSFPASGSFAMSKLFASGGQSIGVSALISVLPLTTRTDLL